MEWISPGDGSAIPKPLALLGKLVAIPVTAGLATVSWFASDVLGRIAALPEALVLGFRAERQRMRTRSECQRIMRQLEAEMRNAVAARRTVFMQAVTAADRIDREFAAFDPKFQDSLETAQAMYTAQMQELRALVADPALHARLDAILASSRPAGMPDGAIWK